MNCLRRIRRAFIRRVFRNTRKSRPLTDDEKWLLGSGLISLEYLTKLSEAELQDLKDVMDVHLANEPNKGDDHEER